MNKTKRYQTGFSAVAVVAVMVVMAVITATGFMVYKQHDKKAVTIVPAAVTSSKKPAAAAAPKAMTQPPADPYAGWKTFTAGSGNLSLKYPADWTLADRTANSNEDRAITLTSATTDAGQFELDVDVLSRAQEKQPPQYSADGTVRTLPNALRTATYAMKWSSKRYNNFQPFDCARLRLLDKTTDSDVALTASEYLSSEGGFCMGQDTYTTKSYQEQLSSQEYNDAIKIYDSIKY